MFSHQFNTIFKAVSFYSSFFLKTMLYPKNMHIEFGGIMHRVSQPAVSVLRICMSVSITGLVDLRGPYPILLHACPFFSVLFCIRNVLMLVECVGICCMFCCVFM